MLIAFVKTNRINSLADDLTKRVFKGGLLLISDLFLLHIALYMLLFK